MSFSIDSALSLGGLREESVLELLDRELLGASGPALLSAVLGLAIAPSIAEELLCRGLLLRGLIQRTGGALAVGISAIAFGALHLEWIQGGAAALLGIYLGTVSLLAGSIRPAILCHAANNLAALAVGVAGATREPDLLSTALGAALAAATMLALVAHVRRMPQL